MACWGVGAVLWQLELDSRHIRTCPFFQLCSGKSIAHKKKPSKEGFFKIYFERITSPNRKAYRLDECKALEF